MVSWPKNEHQLNLCRALFQLRCGASLPQDAHYLAWVVDNQPVWVVGFYDWVGHTCQLSQCNSGPRMIPRALARAVFTYAFDVLKRKMVFAVVSEGNGAAMRVNRFLGFQEAFRWPEMAAHDHDLVVLTMTREQCKFLEKPNDARSAAVS